MVWFNFCRVKTHKSFYSYSERMLGAHVLSDLEMNSIADRMDFSTDWGKQTFLDRFSNPSHTISELKQRQLPLLALRHTSVEAQSALLRSELSNHIAPNVNTINDCLKDSTSMDPRIQESIQQILWSKSSILSQCNTYSPIVNGLITWKTIIVPFMSILMPILAVIVPFFMLRFMHGSESISITDYMGHIKTIVMRQISIPSILRAKSSDDRFGYILESLFLGLSLATFISGLWNQVMSAIHLRTIAKDMKARGLSIYTIIQSAKRVLSILQNLPIQYKRALRKFIEKGEIALCPFNDGFPSEPLAVFGSVWNNSDSLIPIKEWLGELDVFITIVNIPTICFPTYQSSISLQINDVYHPGLVSGIPNTASFAPKQHVLLTGPNRGGKSTFCKAIGISILTAQTWGFAWAKTMQFSPFSYIETALSITDELGKLSLFEAEIEFAKRVLEITESATSPVFIMMDEIFHSTNAKDGIAASRVFLDRLYKSSQTVSLISTHYHELVDQFNTIVNGWAMNASETKEGRLHYTYRVIPGISTKSSVMEILEERGLIIK